MKVKKINSKTKKKGEKILIQIIDVSDRKLYTEVNAEKTFLTLINATVSHELRNPLSSLIAQTMQMNNLFENLEELISEMRSSVQNNISENLINKL